MSLKRFAKNTAIYGIATILPRIVNVLLLRLFTSELKAASFSDATYFWIFASLFNVILTYGMETAFFRFYTKMKNSNKVSNTAFTSIVISTIFFLFVIMLLRYKLAEILNFDVRYFTILIWVVILDTLVVIPYAYLRVHNRPLRYTFYKLANIFIYVVSIIFFFKLQPFFNIKSISAFFHVTNNAIYIYYSNLIASAATLFLFIPVLRKFRLSIDRAIWIKMIRYGLPVMVAGLAYVINENLDKYLLRNMLGREIMGAYSATYKIGVFMSLYITAFRLGAEPFFFSHSEHKNAKIKYAEILLWFTIAGSIFYVFIVAYMDVIAGFFIRKKEYFTTIAIVPVILLANLFLGIYYNLTVWYKLTDKTRFGMYLSLLGALITVFVNVFFIPVYGFMASAWATLASYGTMTITSYLLGKKYYKVPYNVSKIILYIILSSIFVFFIFKYLYHNMLLKTLLFVIYLLMVFILERKKITAIFLSRNTR